MFDQFKVVTENRFPSLFAVDTFRHFWPQILNSLVKSPFLTGKLSFWAIFPMWIFEVADKKSASTSTDENVQNLKGWWRLFWYRYFCLMNAILSYQWWMSTNTRESVGLRGPLVSQCCMFLDLKSLGKKWTHFSD